LSNKIPLDKRINIGIIISMATEKQRLNRMKKEAIIFLYARGYAYKEIATVLKVTRQWVFMVCKNGLDKNEKP